MTDITLIDKPINRRQLKKIAERLFGDMVKGVVDIEKEIMAIGGELHADEEAYLLDQKSKQANLWGINMYPDLEMPDFLEFDSMINIRPSQNNNSRTVEDQQLQQKITAIAKKLVSDA